MTAALTLDQALANYRRAVANTEFWADHGTRGDGKLREAQDAEREARREVRLAARAEVSK